MFLYHSSWVFLSENKMFLADNLAKIFEDIFFTNLLTARKKKCDNLVDKFNNKEECKIDLNDGGMNFDNS